MKILVINLDNGIGDLVLTSPLISALRNAYPGALIDILLRQKHRELFLYNPCVNNVICAPSRKELQQNPTKYFAVLKKIRSNHYDIAINPYSSDTTALFTIFGGAKKRYGFIPKKFYRIFYTNSKLLGKMNYSEYEKSMHRVDLNLSVLELLNIKTEEYFPTEIWVDENTTARG